MADQKLVLSDRMIVKLPFADSGQYKVRDAELPGLMLLVGRRTKTFMAQGEFWRDGERQFSSRIKIGEVGETTTQKARAKAKETLGLIARGVRPGEPDKPRQQELTLRAAWVRYRDAHMVRKGRSPGTIANYEDHVGRLLAKWADKPLRNLAEQPSKVVTLHDEISKRNGPYIANGAMRTLRAIYNHALKTNTDLPARNPVTAIDWNRERRRDTALGVQDLPAWFGELAKLENPIRREFHLFTLLSGSRPTAIKTIRIEHINWPRRTLHIPNPKGGTERAFDIPLSHAMIACLIRAIRLSRQLAGEKGTPWVFAAVSAAGHIVEQKEDRAVLSKWGNDLRQSYRTLAQAAGVSEFDARLLMNHSIQGVNAGYITRHKLLDTHLRQQQTKISLLIMQSASTVGTERTTSDGRTGTLARSIIE